MLLGCSSQGDRGEPIANLALAEDALKRGEHDRALTLLGAWADESYARPELERKMILEAKARLAAGEPWKTYQRLRDFPDLHRFSPLLRDAEQLVFTAGRTLIESNGGFLFFSNDSDDGQVVLEHFIVHYPRARELVPDALRLLAEKAFKEQKWPLCRERMSQVLREYPDSEWATLARFRVAMTRFFQLEGPAYDLEALTLAHNELKDFLAGVPENPKFRSEATKALGQTRAWLGTKHVQIASFYRRLGNRFAEQTHLAIAVAEFGETSAAAEAATLLRAMEGLGKDQATSRPALPGADRTKTGARPGQRTP